MLALILLIKLMCSKIKLNHMIQIKDVILPGKNKNPKGLKLMHLNIFPPVLSQATGLPGIKFHPH